MSEPTDLVSAGPPVTPPTGVSSEGLLPQLVQAAGTSPQRMDLTQI